MLLLARPQTSHRLMRALIRNQIASDSANETMPSDLDDICTICFRDGDQANVIRFLYRSSRSQRHKVPAEGVTSLAYVRMANGFASPSDSKVQVIAHDEQRAFRYFTAY